MDFLEMMTALMKVKEVFPTVCINAETQNWHGSTLNMTVSISDENAELLRQAIEMFEPRSD